MSDFVFTDYPNYNSEVIMLEKKTLKKGIKKRAKIIIVLCISLFLFLFIDVFVFFFVIPASEPLKIDFSGISSEYAYSLGSELSKSCGTTWFSFDKEKAASLISSHSGVRSVLVEKKFPDKIAIIVSRRLPVAMTLIELEDRTIPVQIDENGILFGLNESVVEDDLPLITGFPCVTVYDGMHLSGVYRQFIEKVAEIQKNNPAYFAALSEIHLMPKSSGNFELALYPINSRIRVLADRNISKELLQYMVIMLDVIGNVQPDTTEIDLRYGTLSFSSDEVLRKEGAIGE